MTEKRPVPRFRGCFVCGKENPIGLNLQLYLEEDKVTGEFTPQLEHQGYRGIAHGGILSSVLDEAMVWTPKLVREVICIGVELSVRFINPAHIGEPLDIEAGLVRDRRKVFETTGELRRKDGTIVAKATGKFMTISKEQAEEVAAYLEPGGED